VGWSSECDLFCSSAGRSSYNFSTSYNSVSQVSHLGLQPGASGESGCASVVDAQALWMRKRCGCASVVDAQALWMRKRCGCASVVDAQALYTRCTHVVDASQSHRKHHSSTKYQFDTRVAVEIAIWIDAVDTRRCFYT
jgi:hypothetical protein